MTEILGSTTLLLRDGRISAVGTARMPIERMPQAQTKQKQKQKEIRFVNNEGRPPPKRRRINSACRTCRKRKTRCDGVKPECETCVGNGHTCLGYVEGDFAEGGEVAEAVSKRDGVPVEVISEEDNGIMEKEVRMLPAFIVQHGQMRDGIPTKENCNELDPELGREEDIRQNRKAFRPIVHKLTKTVAFPDTNTNSHDLPSPPPDGHKVPYFRYFGPTAIVPGFKQMVVSVREHRRSTCTGSSVAMSPGSCYGGSASSHTGSERRPPTEMPMYDQSDSTPVHHLIIHLVETFFTHLGCSYPFLRRKTFVPRVEDRLVEPILVDAVCALAARFSDHPLLRSTHDPSYPKSEYGHVFAQRAKAAVVDTFPCPTVAAVQACLLLAYEGFGANQDSALWMYLGCAIRMAVDLGLQKIDGVKHQGQKDPGYHRLSNEAAESDPSLVISAQERKEVEQERIDTLWAVFMLDRAISSGTGRPVALRDEDFELSFPAVSSNAESGWPNPFPALIQIIHLYGRVSDLLNNIRDVRDVTHEKIEGLSAMEKDLTELYQRLDQRLTFNAANFQHYVKSGEGTNFILVHFWFHTLIMLLHQPTLMHSFERQNLQLLPNSRELSISSAKTIADILAFAELIDPKSFIANPFTSQPMYIAACAFLMESAAHTSSRPTSRSTSPPLQNSRPDSHIEDIHSNSKGREEHSQKHSLLASAANQNYQRCYKALQQLETYWGGTRYIIVALDQKSKGIWDPETYTEQEYEMTKIHNGMIPSWGRKLSLAATSPRADNRPRSPAIDPSQAIGWSLTGTTNSPSSNLTFMYQPSNSEHINQTNTATAASTPAGNMIYDPIRSSLPESRPVPSTTTSLNSYPQYTSYNQRHIAPLGLKYGEGQYEAAATANAEMLLELQGSPYSISNQQDIASPNSQQHSYDRHLDNHMTDRSRQSSDSPSITHHSLPRSQLQRDIPTSYPRPHPISYLPSNPNEGLNTGNANTYINGSTSNAEDGFTISDMMMESQEIDMATVMAGGEMMGWLEYLPQDVLCFLMGLGGWRCWRGADGWLRG